MLERLSSKNEHMLSHYGFPVSWPISVELPFTAIFVPFICLNLIGLLLYIFSGTLLSVSLYFASPGMILSPLGLIVVAVVSPLMSVVLVSNAILAHFFLREEFTKRDVAATMIIVMRSTFSVLSVS